MAFVGSISGSLGTTDVTGSLVPSVLGTNNLGSSTAKWGTVYSNYITGSISGSAAGTAFLAAGSNINLNYNSLGQWEITGTSVSTLPGGVDTQVQFNDGGSTFGGDAGLTYNKTTDTLSAVNVSSTAVSASYFAPSAAKIAFVGQGGVAPASFGTNGFLFFSGSNTARAIFGGPVVMSSSLDFRDATHASVASISTTGVITGSSISGSSNLLAGGNLTVAGTSTLVGDIIGSGDLAVNGGDITTSAATFNIAAAGGGGTTINIGSAASRVVVPGDLEVQGTTITLDAVNLTVEDALVGFGFTTGSVAGSAGDRGFIGGITGAGNNVAFVWSNSNSTFAATKTTSAPGDSSVTLSTLQPVRVSAVQLNGANATLSSGDGSKIDLNAPGVLSLSGSQLRLTGSTISLGGLATDVVSYVGSVGSNVLPAADVSYDLGSTSFRWRNIYTGDLHLRNDRGDYTLIEEADFLSIRFNKTGKRYKFVLEPVPELDGFDS